MTPQFDETLKRGAWLALATGHLVALEPYRDQQHVARAIVLGLIAAVTALIGRGCVEGAVDSGRAKRGDVIPSDVR